MIGPDFVISPLEIKVPTTIPRPLWDTADRVIAEDRRRHHENHFLDWFNLLEVRLDELGIGTGPSHFRPYVDGTFEDICSKPETVTDKGSKIEVVRLVCDRPEQDILQGGWVLRAEDYFVDRKGKRISVMTGDEEIRGVKTSKDYDVEWNYTEETGPSVEDHGGDISLVVGRKYERDVLQKPQLGQHVNQVSALLLRLEPVTLDDIQPVGRTIQVVDYPTAA